MANTTSAKRINITFQENIFEYINGVAEAGGQSFGICLNGILRSVGEERINAYHDGVLDTAHRDYVGKSVKKTYTRTVRFSDALYDKIESDADRREQTFSQYINLAVAASMAAEGAREEKTQTNGTGEVITKTAAEPANGEIVLDDMLKEGGAYYGLPANIDNMTVEKSASLLDLPFNGYNITQLKLVDAYLARINPRDPNKRIVILTLEDAQQLTGIKRLRKDTLEKFLNKINEKVNLRHINDESSDYEIIYDSITLFQRVAAYKDKKTRKTLIFLKCTDDAQKLFFELKKYIKYDFHRIKEIKSVKTYSLLMHIEQNAYNYRLKPWVTSVNKLRNLLSANTEYYSEYKYFKRTVFAPAMADINEKCNMTVDYEEISNGDTVTDIRFIIRNYDTRKKLGAGENDTVEELRRISIDLTDFEALVKRHGVGEADELYDVFNRINIETNNEFTYKQLFNALEVILAKMSRGACYDSERAVEYSRQAYEILNRKRITKGVDDAFSYYRGILSNGHPERFDFEWFKNDRAAEQKSGSVIITEAEYTVSGETKEKEVDKAVIAGLAEIAETYTELAGWRSESFDSQDLKTVYECISEFTNGRFNGKRVLNILDAVMKRLIEADCFTVSAACDYSHAAYDILTEAEKDTDIENPVKYLKGIIANGNPERKQGEWFAREEKAKTTYMEHNYSKEETERYVKSLEDDDF